MSSTNTLALIKPKAVENGNIGAILHTINAAGLRIRGLKMMRFTKKQAENFYAGHKKAEFFNELIEFICSGPIVAAVISGEDAVDQLRTIIGATDPKIAASETIRAKFGTNTIMNAIHGSDSNENALRETELVFRAEELF